MNERNQAVVLMLLSALSFSLMQAVVKLSATNIGTMEQVFCRNLISMAISFVLLRRSHLPLLGSRNHQPALLARSFFGFIGVVMLFSATAGARQAAFSPVTEAVPVALVHALSEVVSSFPTVKRLQPNLTFLSGTVLRKSRVLFCDFVC